VVGVLVRLAALLVIAFAAIAPRAAAQSPTPTPTPTPTATPTPTPTPAPERSEAVKRVYRDYRRDGVIEACDHKRKTLRKTLDTLDPGADTETPDLRPALEAAIEQRKSGDCDKPEATPTPSPTATPAPTATVAPTTAPTPNDDLGSGSVSPLPGGGGEGGGGNPKPPSSGDVTPLEPEVTPVPPAAPAPAEPSGPVATPSPVYTNSDDAVPVSLLALAVLLALLALLALVLAALGRLGWAESRLAGPGRAVREAAFRAGGTWGDFADWLRLGR
jgi:hypothetical protein